MSGRLLDAGSFWQLCAAGGTGAALLLRMDDDAPPWWQRELAALDAAAGASLQLVEGYRCICLPPGEPRPAPVAGLALRSPPVDRAEARALADALHAMARRCPAAAWESALFLRDPPLALATAEQAGEDHRAVLVAALSGGFRDAALPPARIAALNPRLDAVTIAAVLDGLTTPPQDIAPPADFLLPGQPELAALLREKVVDPLHRPAAYARLGVPPPGGVLLAGPPGCGKSFCAARLAAFLHRRLFEISVAGVGSALLHETSRRLVAAFDAAAAAAPAVILLEELDALGRDRAGAHQASGEEVNTLLRLVEAAPARDLLVLGTTNRLDAIDPALRRRGRFDIVFTMDHPDEAGMAAMLGFLLDGRPHADGLDLGALGHRLSRRPASDLVWVVNEAARMAVRGGQAVIDELLLARAVKQLDSQGRPGALPLDPTKGRGP